MREVRQNQNSEKKAEDELNDRFHAFDEIRQ